MAARESHPPTHHGECSFVLCDAICRVFPALSQHATSACSFLLCDAIGRVFLWWLLAKGFTQGVTKNNTKGFTKGFRK